MPSPHFERSKPLGSERSDASRSGVVGACGDIADGVVLEHARTRHVAGLRFALAPGRDLDQDGELLGLAHAGLEPHPGARRLGAVGVGRGEDFHLVVHPVGAAAPAEIGDQRRIDVAQMGHVGDRVGDLGRRQRPPGPVGEAVRLVEHVAGDALHELVVGDRIAVAQHHGGDLGVEDRMRDDVGAVPDDFDVLPGGVEHLEHVLVRHQLEERLEVDARRQRIDHHGLVARRQLRHAEQRVVGGLAEELGVDGDEGVARQPFAGGGQFLRRGDQVHAGLT